MKTTILRQLIVLPLLTAVMAMLYACGSAGAGATAAPKRFTTTYLLQQGASAVIAPAATSGINSANGAIASAPIVRLERVNDSRCRTGVVCVWAGYISYSFSLTKPDGSSSNFVLSDSMPNGTPSVTQHGLTFTLAGAKPEAVPGKNEIAPDYQVSLRVSNAPPPDPRPRPS